MSLKWTNEEDAVLYKYYGKVPYDVMQPLLPGRTKSGIGGRAWLLGLKGNNSLVRRQLPRKYEINFDFFDEITPLTCALAGLLAADGSIVEKKRGVVIHLKESDGYLLEQWSNVVGYTGPVAVYSNHNSTYSPDGKNATLTIYGVPKWLEQLDKVYNVVPKKSLILKPPNLEKREHILAYMSGLVDGDGSIFLHEFSKKDQYTGKLYPCEVWSMSIVGTQEICSWFRDIAESFYPSRIRPAKIMKRKKKNSILYQYRMSGQRVQHLAKEIGELNLPRLKRKWDPIINSEITTLGKHGKYKHLQENVE